MTNNIEKIINDLEKKKKKIIYVGFIALAFLPLTFGFPLLVIGHLVNIYREYNAIIGAVKKSDEVSDELVDQIVGGKFIFHNLKSLLDVPNYVHPKPIGSNWPIIKYYMGARPNIDYAARSYEDWNRRSFYYRTQNRYK